MQDGRMKGLSGFLTKYDSWIVRIISIIGLSVTLTTALVSLFREVIH
jgi:hypothetical protein